MAPRVSLPAASLLIALAAAPFAAANHPQPVAGSAASFDHWKGNEWWVEVKLGGFEACRARLVESRDDGGAWVRLGQPSWASCIQWVGSYHVEPGHRVQFRAHYTSTDTPLLSCWFTHPAGQEHCPTEAGTFAASFAPTAGNDWWVQVRVDANEAVSWVGARVNGAAWNTLAKKSWGDYAASFRVPPGSLVEFAARSAAGAHDFSYQGYRWPNREAVPAASPIFSVLYANPEGHASWQEINTYSNYRLTGVDVRINGGDWRPLVLQAWGDWAASYSASAGSKVQFRSCESPVMCVTSSIYTWPPG